jgi:heat shock protein HslJ
VIRRVWIGAMAVCVACQPRPSSVPNDSSAAAAPDSARVPGMARLTARGNEPGWILTISGDSLAFIGNYGEDTVRTLARASSGQGAWTYVAAAESMTVTVRDSICGDDATGMPHPYAVNVTLRGNAFRGCGGEPVALLSGGPWTVSEIAGRATADPSPTLEFGAAGRVAGSTSCNQYSAPFTLTGEGLRLGPVVATKRACEPAVMQQETRFLSVLGRIARFEVPSAGELRLVTDGTDVIVARRGG